MRVKIGLYRDAMTPTIEALVLEKGGSGIRLTSMKGCGRWNLVKTFVCELEPEDIENAAEGAREAGG